MMELGRIQFNLSTKHTELEMCGVEAMCTAREKALATLQSTYNRQTGLWEVPGTRSVPRSRDLRRLPGTSGIRV